MVSFSANATTTNLNNLNISTIVQEDEQADAPAESASFTQELKKRFIEGGPGFMGIVLISFDFRISDCDRKNYLP